MEYTVEVYKIDRRVKSGERLVKKYDVVPHNLVVLEHDCSKEYPASKGYLYAIHETYVTRKNLISEEEFTERYDTPSFCSPSSEAYWSM